jgi:hypothetical protein
LIAAGFLASCEKQEYFKSESDVKKELSYTWTQVLMSHDTNLIYMYYVWTFKDDELTMVLKKASDNRSLDTLFGNYSVRTSLTKVFVTTYNFPDVEAWYWMNAEWTDVALDHKGLVVAAEDPRAGGVKTLEFTRE